MSGLFSTLNVATRGMSVQQKSLDVTSHNIANANTKGYSRQRALIETTRPFGMPSLNNVSEPGQLGTGAQISAIQRYRDAFLDYQTRVEASTKGQYDAKETILGEVESIFNEPSDTGLSTLIGKFFDSWQNLSKQPQSSNTRTIVAQQSSALADDLNHTYTQLENLKTNVQIETKNAVVDINSMLDQIEKLNQQIVGVTVAGNRANDLMDKRDLLLDELSSQFNIDVTTQPFDGVDVKPVGMTQSMIISQNVGAGNRLSYDTVNNKVIWTDSAGTPLTNGAGTIPFQPTDGAIKGYSDAQVAIDNYMSDLNKLAKTIAFSVNAVHSGQAAVADDTMPFFVNSTVGGTEDQITAKNISVNKAIITDVMKINTKTNSTDGETDGSRALAIAQVRNSLIKMTGVTTSSSRSDMLTTNPFVAGSNNTKLTNDTTSGTTVDNYFKDTINTLGIQSQEAKRMVKNQDSLLANFEESRASVSGVSLDEEMANLVQYQHAYQANAKIIATIDELLDVVINGLKR